MSSACEPFFFVFHSIFHYTLIHTSRFFKSIEEDFSNIKQRCIPCRLSEISIRFVYNSSKSTCLSEHMQSSKLGIKTCRGSIAWLSFLRCCNKDSSVEGRTMLPVWIPFSSFFFLLLFFSSVCFFVIVILFFFICDWKYRRIKPSDATHQLQSAFY